MNDKHSFQVPTVSKIFLCVVFAECLSLAAICAVLFFNTDSADTKVNLAVVFTSCLFLCYFAFDAVFTENQFQLIAFYVLSILMCARVVYGYWFPDAPRSDTANYLYLAGLCVATLLEIFYFVVGVCIEDSVWNNFGYYHYKFVSAIPREKDMYITYQQMLTLLRVDFAFCAVWVILAFRIVSPLQLSFNFSAIFATVTWALLGWMASVRESNVLMKMFWVLSVVWPVFLGYQCYTLWTHQTSRSAREFNVFAAGGASVIARILILVWSHFVASNFGRGLKQKVFDKKANYGTQKSVNSA
eukprot:TRINITY_DN3418_c0_g2_i1.p1 TRINITY_DN3418_c0_g2~~TRINITY_DN3418_c0_g2_i1.p1  ORF type:complete len:338 (+),score=87.04 TRINITY_DN3418_c0_g2_i1:117-1016(+)